MDKSLSLQDIEKFLNSQSFGRIATIDASGQVQIANVGFSQNEKLELLIGTSEVSRKSNNIEHNSVVAFEATDTEKRITVQYHGRARKLTRDEFELRSAAHFKKLPGSLPFKDIQGQVYILIAPTWVRYSDCNGYPWKIFEHEFKAT